MEGSQLVSNLIIIQSFRHHEDASLALWASWAWFTYHTTCSLGWLGGSEHKTRCQYNCLVPKLYFIAKLRNTSQIEWFNTHAVKRERRATRFPVTPPSFIDPRNVFIKCVWPSLASTSHKDPPASIDRPKRRRHFPKWPPPFRLRLAISRDGEKNRFYRKPSR